MAGPAVLRYDEGLVEELRRVYGRAYRVFLEWLARPPERYYVRVNTLRADPGEVVDELRAMGHRAYVDEVVAEAVWLPVGGPSRIEAAADCTIVVDKRTAESVMMGAHVYGPGVVEVRGECRTGGEAVAVPAAAPDLAVALLVVEDLEAVQRGRGLVARNVRPLYRVPSLRDTRLHAEGAIYEQSLPSILTTRLLAEALERPPRLVVDMCAAPGGKTGHAVELLGARGAAIYAFDHSRRKLDRMRDELKRLGHLDRVRVIRADSRYLDVDFPELVGRVDALILDPPCTALGVVPKVYDEKSGRDVASAAEYQRQFVKVAARLLAPCGVMVYSTCTVTAAENEEVVAFAESLGLRVEEPPLRHPRSSRGLGLPEAVRFHPHVHGMPGHFIALLRKPCGRG